MPKALRSKSHFQIFPPKENIASVTVNFLDSPEEEKCEHQILLISREFHLHLFALPSYEGKFLGWFVKGKTLGNPLQRLVPYTPTCFLSSIS